MPDLVTLRTRPWISKAAPLVTRLSIEVIGGLVLSVCGTPLRLANRKARAILAYLALEDAAVVSRERLAGLFWGESSEQQARNSLRQALFEIREALALPGIQLLGQGRDDVQLNRSLVQLDLAETLDAISVCKISDPMSRLIPGTDALLAGYEDLSPLFGEWLTTTRRNAQNEFLAAMRASCVDPRWPSHDRRRMASAILQLDPLDEAACRVGIRLASEAGEVGVAIRLYSALYDAMGVELDMEPSDATQALIAEVKQGRITAPAIPSTLVASASSNTRLSAAGVPIVAILPLRVTGTDDEWMALGVVEEIVRVLARLREPVVISTNSTHHICLSDQSLSQTGEQLGAHYLVTGSLRLAGGRGRIQIELVDAPSQAALWSERFDFEIKDLFETQEEIAARIAHTLVPHVHATELRRNADLPPEDLGAYHLVLRARMLMFRLEREAFEDAGVLLREARARDSLYSGVHAMLANWFSLRVFQGWSDDRAGDIAALLDAARIAIELSPGNARALALLGHFLMLVESRHDEALRLFERADATAPNDAEALGWSVPTFAYMGAGTDAVARAQRALMLSPQDPFLFRYQHMLSLAHYSAGQCADAAEWGMRSRSSNPNYSTNLRICAAALAACGRVAEARTLAAEHGRLDPAFRLSNMTRRNVCRDERLSVRLRRDMHQAGLPI